MNDLISRQAAIDAMTDLPYGYRGLVRCIIAALPSVQQNTCVYWDAESEFCARHMPSAQPQQWIPCSERLPDNYTDVLVWFEYFRYGDYNCLYQTYGIGDYSTKYDSWMINHETGWRKLRVIAWMPLPEPYKAESEGE